MIPSQTNVSRIQTPRGPVEFAVAGNGPPILYFHGTPCSSSLAIEMERQLLADNFQLIVPQRPGYYGTPLGNRLTTADCAEMAIHVLDHLKIDRVATIGTSGGGPPVLAFAVRYPERNAALILQCAQTHRWDDARWGPPSQPWLTIRGERVRRTDRIPPRAGRLRERFGHLDSRRCPFHGPHRVPDVAAVRPA